MEWYHYEAVVRIILLFVCLRPFINYAHILREGEVEVEQKRALHRFLCARENGWVRHSLFLPCALYRMVILLDGKISTDDHTNIQIQLSQIDDAYERKYQAKKGSHV